MKRLEVTFVENQSEKAVESLRRLELIYTVLTTDVENGKFVVYSILGPDELIDEIIDESSQKIDLHVKENTIDVYPVEAYVSTHLDKLKEKVPKAAPSTNPFGRLIDTRILI